MVIIAAVLAVSLILFGATVFASIARPHLLLGWVAWWSGEREAWLDGTLSDEQQQRYYSLLSRGQPFLLMLVFAWSFLVGAVVALSRL
jgi:hypothetical protein